MTAYVDMKPLRCIMYSPHPDKLYTDLLATSEGKYVSINGHRLVCIQVITQLISVTHIKGLVMELEILASLASSPGPDPAFRWSW